MTLNPHGISFSILPSCKASTQVALGGEIWSEPSASDVQKKILEGCSSYSLPTYYLHFMQGQKVMHEGSMSLQVILFEIDCAIFYTNLHELFCQFISWTNWVNSGKFMDKCWISCQVMADMKKGLRRSHNH